ncbi:MAG TPA: DNA polymerase III subunit gamma/tau [Candidatus Binataceae bacterium]
MAASPSSHLVLARKWRPERFSELVGQEHVTRTLAQALKSGRIAHAFLFTGIRGVGKTTAARIMARCLNCEQGPTPDPCGTCAACVEIRTGSALDVVEIDGATYRKIDDARAIIENLSYRPARDRFKIYIIDEAHQLTDQAFNALLKTLEEPPAHVKFILATTEPQKMPETILSRLQRYDFRRIPFAVIFDRLKELAAREGAGADEGALRMLAREAGGSMRDAERMLETAIASLEGQVTEREVASILGVAGRSRVFAIVEAILNKDAAVALGTVRELHRSGANLESLGRDILELLRNLAVAKLPAANSPQSPLADLPDQEAAELTRLSAVASNRDLMRLFRLMADAQEQLIRSPYPDLLLEMVVIRMATLAPVIDADELLQAIGASVPVGRSAGGGSASGNSSGQSPHSPTAGSTDATGDATKAAPSVASVDAVLAPTPARRIRVEGEVKAEAPPRAVAVQPKAASVVSSSGASAGTSGGLPDLREFIRGRRAALFGFMEQGAALALNGDVLTIIPRNDIYIRYLSDNRGVIGDLASELYGRRIRVELAPIGTPLPPAGATSASEVAPAGGTATAAVTPSAASHDGGSGAADTGGPAASAEEPQAAAATDGADAAPSVAAADVPAMSQADLRQTVYADPVVRRIFDEFEARLVEVRVQAVAPPTVDSGSRKP